MAGGVSKTFGMMLTILGAFGILAGIAVAVYGISALEAESREAFPDRRNAETSVQIAFAGFATLGTGMAVLLLGLPMLIWGANRYRDPATGRVRTEAGGAMRAFGFTFLTLALISAVVGAAVMVTAMAIAESGSSGFNGEARGDMAEALWYLGIVAAALAAVFFVLGLPLAFVGGVRGGQTDGAIKAAARTATAQGEPAPASVPRNVGWSPTQSALAVVGGIAILSLLMVAIFQPGGATLGALATHGPPPFEETYEGRLTGLTMPVAGSASPENGSGAHAFTPPSTRGHFEAHLSWQETELAPERLILVLEVEDTNGAWREVARKEGAQPVSASSGLELMPGKARAVVMFPEGTGGDAYYVLHVVARSA